MNAEVDGDTATGFTLSRVSAGQRHSAESSGCSMHWPVRWPSCGGKTGA